MEAHQDITYRKTIERDRSFLLSLYASTREDVRMFANDMTAKEKDTFIEMQFDLQDHHYKTYYPQADFLIILSSGKKIGRLYVEEDQDNLCVINITIDPEFRSQGIGRKIMSTLISKAAIKNIPISIYVAKNNKAITFYNRLGFEIVKDTPVYHYMIKKPEVKQKISNLQENIKI